MLIFFALIDFIFSDTIYIMNDKLISELFILGIQILICIRVFFVQQKTIVSIVILSPLSVLLSILQICIWGLGISEGVIFIISLLIFIGNTHALTRLQHHLFTDLYNIPFFIFSVLMLIVTALCITLLLYLHPAYYKKSQLHTVTTKTYMTGSLQTGYTPRQIFDPLPNMTIWTIQPQKDLEVKQPVILFVPDLRSNTQNYMPVLQELANKGFIVISADCQELTKNWFHSYLDIPQIRSSAIVYQSLYHSEAFENILQTRTDAIVNVYDHLIAYSESQFGKDTKYYLLADVASAQALTIVAPKHPYKIVGVYSLHYDTDYQTPGYGCLDSTDPVTAWLHGLRTFDQDMFIARYIAIKTSNKIQNAYASYHVQEVSNDTQ